jgi:hypothetical protein
MKGGAEQGEKHRGNESNDHNQQKVQTTDKLSIVLCAPTKYHLFHTEVTEFPGELTERDR